MPTHHSSQDCCCQWPSLCGRPLLTHTYSGNPQTLTGRSGSVSCRGSLQLSPGSWCTQGFVCTLQESLASKELDFNKIAPLLSSCCNFSFVLGHEVSCPHCGFQHSFVNGCSAVSYDFGVLPGEDECMFFYSTILFKIVYINLVQKLLMYFHYLSNKI